MSLGVLINISKQEQRALPKEESLFLCLLFTHKIEAFSVSQTILKPKK